jgi:hypothetical protein
MTRDDVISMAREQGLPETEIEGVFVVNADDLGRMLRRYALCDTHGTRCATSTSTTPLPGWRGSTA